MFLLQLRYELKNLLRSPMSWLLLTFLFVCMGFGAWNGKYSLEQKQKATADILSKQVEKLSEKRHQADSIVKNEITVEKWWTDPTTPLAVLATGMSDLQPEAEKLFITRSSPISSSDFENPVNLSFGSFDLAFVLVFLLPLFIIAFTFNLVSAEREQGTLALLLSQPVEARRLFTMKMLARFCLLAGLSLVVFIPVLLWTGIRPSELALWQAGGAVVVYCLFWFLLSLAINLLHRNSAFNALACLGAWLTLAIVVPALVNMTAEKVHPVPSRAGYQNAIREADKEVEKHKERILSDFFQSHPQYTRKKDEEKETYDWWVEGFAMTDFEQAMKDSIAEDFDKQVIAQTSFSERLIALSPALSLHHRLTALAGTGREATQAYKRGIRQQQQEWSATMRQKYLDKQKVTAVDYDDILKKPAVVKASAAVPKRSGMWWLWLQCLVIGVWAWWNGRESG